MEEIELAELVMRVIRAHLLYFEDDDVLPLDQDLNELGLDSMAKVEIILEIEGEAGITVPDEMLVERHFGTPQAIIETVETCSPRGAPVADGVVT
jgi:acyl carrier protein